MYVVVIYNLSGLIVGGAGVLAGLLVSMVSTRVVPGLLTLAAVWFVGGFWWRSREIAPGVKRPFPAVFFIPLPIYAIPVACLAFLPLLVMGRSAPPADRRADLLQADERMLESAPANGDVPLSQKILAALQAIPVEGKTGATYHVATRKSGDAVLVLVKAPALKTLNVDVRQTLLQKIAETLRADDPSKRFFIGIKGQLIYGAVQTPPDVVEIANVVSPAALCSFYDDPADAVTVAVPERQPAVNPVVPTNVPAPQRESGGVAPGASSGADELRHRGADRVEVVRPAIERAPGPPTVLVPREPVRPPAAVRPTFEKPATRARVDRPDIVRPPLDRAAARTRKSEDQSSEPSDRAAERDARRAERKKRTDETVAGAKLRTAEAFRKTVDPATYRKRLQEIVDKHPRTEAAKKAAELLE